MSVLEELEREEEEADGVEEGRRRRVEENSTPVEWEVSCLLLEGGAKGNEPIVWGEGFRTAIGVRTSAQAGSEELTSVVQEVVHQARLADSGIACESKEEWSAFAPPQGPKSLQLVPPRYPLHSLLPSARSYAPGAPQVA